ncbi:MAG TPA: gamma carbonic anhydrase family protein [Gammaproteobacteria bacterium]|nr:gamma carbonic anhydrase family protein [Gammaproteobacteria bacterium]
MSLRSFCGSSPRIAPSAYVDETALVIGDVTIGEDSSLWPMAVARGDVHRITIGARTNIQDGSILHVTQDNAFNPGGFPLNIGDEVTVGHGAILHACTIGDRVLVGMGATVLDGAVIHGHAMIAAGALVPPGKVLDGGYLYVGSPARQVRPLTDKELEYLAFSARHYVALKNQHQAMED